MSRQRRGERRPERGRRRKKGGRRTGRPLDDASRAPDPARRTTLLVRGLVVLAVAAAVAGTTAVGLVTRDDTLAGSRETNQDDTQRQTKPQEKASTPKVRGPVLPPSTPVAIRVPSLDIQARLMSLGLEADGTVEEPPAKYADRAGWYAASPTPGEAGPSVVVGHTVPTKGMPRPVFKGIGKVKPGAAVEIARADKVIAVFRVDRVKRYPVTHFPADEVYGAVDHAGLRLITYTPPSSKPADNATNVVVYASLLKSRPVG